MLNLTGPLQVRLYALFKIVGIITQITRNIFPYS